MKKLVPGMPFSPNEMSRGPDHLIVKTLATIACVKGDRETEITPEWAIMDFKESKKYYAYTPTSAIQEQGSGTKKQMPMNGMK